MVPRAYHKKTGWLRAWRPDRRMNKLSKVQQVVDHVSESLPTQLREDERTHYQLYPFSLPVVPRGFHGR